MQSAGGLPPLVEPGAPLGGAESARTQRQARLPELGEIGQRRLANARVLVVGAGGLGAPALLYLAAAGVGTIGIVDDDVVSVSDLHRQVIHSAGAVGEPKVDSAARRLAGLAPLVVVRRYPVRLDETNVASLLTGYDLVLDGADTFATRFLVSDACAVAGLPLVWASVLRFDAQVSVFWSHPPSDVAPVTLRDLFPEPPAAHLVPSCAEAGVLGALCGIVGSMMAIEAIKLVAGIGRPLLGRVAVVDALTMRVREVPLVPGPAAHEDPAAEARPSGVPARAAWAPDDGPGALTLEAYLDLTRDPARPTVLLDVREPSEHAVDALAGAVNVPISHLVQAARGDQVAELLAAAGVPDDAQVVAYCSHGIRAARAVGILTEAGRRAGVLSPEAVARLWAAERVTR
ncbi:MAG: hypothetical protein BGO37_10305 [Cellulomonas sp. 73-92]|uniref:ThiF family adenylyltransferase n=1 Tax=Cellulomonas sp. 73-92 TaxID=1895740 RepID=UPI0009264143|nr:ThiF family adenylyltransferase [Cellulomonas sp. 73-92]OJV76446.1 MAG: hypothetical protein BGO37_10305 [Cellulomonas sp. 73-92]